MRNWNNYNPMYNRNDQNRGYGAARGGYNQARLWGKKDSLYTPTKLRK